MLQAYHRKQSLVEISFLRFSLSRAIERLYKIIN